MPPAASRAPARGIACLMNVSALYTRSHAQRTPRKRQSGQKGCARHNWRTKRTYCENRNGQTSRKMKRRSCILDQCPVRPRVSKPDVEGPSRVRCKTLCSHGNRARRVKPCALIHVRIYATFPFRKKAARRGGFLFGASGGYRRMPPLSLASAWRQWGR